MFGWGSFAGDLALARLVAPRCRQGFGAFNWSGYSESRVDALLERAFAEPTEAREALAPDSMRLGHAGPTPSSRSSPGRDLAMKQSARYAPRTDEFTFSHHFRAQ